jgi:Rhs element Vgr protein
MGDARTLPIAATHREFVVKIDGSEVGREHHLLGVRVTRTANRIASARLVYLDGSAASSDFPLSNAGTFAPGKDVEILAGPSDSQASLFKGVVIQQAIKVRPRVAPQLVVECRHKAVKLAVGRRNAYYFDQTDSDIMTTLIQNAGLSGDIETTSVSHPQQVQFRCTDWDFLVSRAEANGRVVFTNADDVVVKAPKVKDSADVTLQFGATILELDLQIDSRLQFSAVKGITWDPAQQAIVERDAADPGISGPGNLSSDDLAGVVGLDSFDLRHGAVSETEAQAWADAQWVKSRLSKVSGHVKCEGVATVNPGDTIAVQGVGDRYNGNVFVTGVLQTFDTVEGWKTHVQCGGADRWTGEERPMAAVPAAALLPSVTGLQIGVVVSNEDPDGEHRVRVRLPLVDAQEDGTWARVASPDAGKDRGFFFRPEVGDEVVAGFLDDDPRQAVILGMLHSSAKAAPLKGSNDNHQKVYQSRSKIRLFFDDDKKQVLLETPGGNRLTLDDDGKTVKLEDQNGNVVEMGQSGVRIESKKSLTLKAGTELKLESGTSLGVKSGTTLKLEGISGAELTSTASTAVKGSIVQLN